MSMTAGAPLTTSTPEHPIESTRSRRPQPPADVEFPVTPMLDMSFQLLAFFILTFQAPSRETRIDLYLPAAPSAMPGAATATQGTPRTARAMPDDLENDLVIRAKADDLGDLASLSVFGSEVPNASELETRLRRYVRVMDDEPVRVRLVADESLRYEEAARLVAACSSAGVTSIRLGGPSDLGLEAGP